MGLDITICVTNPEEVYTGDYADPLYDGWEQHRLSRQFCNFMYGRYDVDYDQEFDQVSHITMINIGPLYAMEAYESHKSWLLNFRINMAKSEEQKRKIYEQDRLDKEMLTGNIDLVLSTINTLIAKLAALPDLSTLLNYNERKAALYEYYFTDFNIDKGDGYIGNNFGQDLRNFKRFLDFAKSRGTTTVYFSYG
jgi:hypothetical protein